MSGGEWNRGMVIVGAGEAGARAAVALRELGWTGSVTIVGEEPDYPYERPPLSKNHLYGEDETLPVTILDANQLQQQNIQFIAGEAVVGIDRAARTVALASGKVLAYERLLLATGANSRKLNVPGNGAEMLYLRRLADAQSIRRKLKPGSEIAFIGGGFIGLEVAASAVSRGCRVTLVEVAPRILMRGVPPEIASLVEARHRKAGVDFRIGVMIERVDRLDDGKLSIAMADGTFVRCDAIVTGIGAVPETGLAAACGLELDNGIKVDERLETSDPYIFAAGDCCSFPHPLFGGRRVRLEAWRNARDQGTHAAGSMLGETTPYAAVPWFWSDQYDETLLVAGLTDGSETTVLRDLGDAGKLYFHLSTDDRVVSVSAMGPTGALSKEFRLAEMLIEAGAKPQPEQLADPGVRLKKLL